MTGRPGTRHITYVRLSDVRPAETNPKRHHLPGIIAALTEHGIIDPPGVDERTGRLVGGHGRVEALVEMKAAGDPIPNGIQLDEDGEWLLPVLRGWASHDDVRAQAALLSLNRLTEAGGWNERELAAMLEDLHAADGALFDGLGWDDADLEVLFRHVDDETGTVLSDADLAQASATDPPAQAPPDGDPAQDEDDAGQEDARGAEVQCPSCAHVFTPGR